MLNICNSQQS